MANTLTSPQMESNDSIPVAITVTDSAVAKVWALIKEEGNLELKLRVYIEGGGCSGFQYGFTFDEERKDDDIVIVKKVTTKNTDKDEDEDGGSGEGHVELVIDAMSYQYLLGSEIDYKDDLEGERFIIRNPNAATTCGCGSSFTL